MDEKKYLKRKEKAQNREQLALSCNHLGDFYNQEGNYKSAVREYLQEAELYSKMGKKLEMAKAHRMVGEMYMLLNDFAKALEHIQIYLKTARGLGNKVEEQRAYATLGRAYLLQGQSLSETSASATLEQLKQAEKAFLKSLLLIKEITGQITKLEQLDMQARCYLNIGVVKEHMEDFEESISYIERAIKICRAHDLFELTHLCYISMSLLYHCKKNDATLALRFCNLALEIAKRLPNKVQKICETLITKSEILIKTGDFSSAKQILTKAYKKNTPNVNDRDSIEKVLRIVVKICQTLDELVTTSSVDYAKCKTLYERLGDGCCLLQNYDKALEYYQKMLECAKQNGDTEKELTPIYVSLYQTYKDNHEYDKALEYLWKEYEINKDVHAEAFSTLCSIAEICELQNQSFWSIQDIYMKAKAHAEKIDDKEIRKKSEKISFTRLWKLQKKHKMNTLVELMEQEAASRGVELEENADDESDADSDGIEHNTPDLGADVCLEDLTDSDTSDLDETEKPRPHRVTRGARCLSIKRNNKGETQLHQACIAGNLELARRLLDQGHIVNVRDHAGWLPLHEACNHGYRDIVALLLDRGAAVAINDKGGTSCDGITPLYDACANGYLDVVELLLERGADATVKTDFGETCLSGLDKWRKTATLTTGEQAHYHQVRTELLRPLTKVGIVSNSSSTTTPLTNAAVDSMNENEDDLSEDNDDDSNDSIPEPYKRVHSQKSGESFGKTLRDNNQKPRASLEYKHVMEQLKHPNRNYETSGSVCSTNSSNKKRNAFLHEEEVDDDTWLIDDVGPERKKRRFVTPTREPQRGTSSSFVDRRSTSKENINDSTYASCFDAIELTPENDGSQGLLDASFNTDQSQPHSSTAVNKPRFSRSSSGTGSTSNLSLSRRNKPKHQASLLDSGFCRFRSESPNSNGDDSNITSALSGTEPDSTTATSSVHLIISPAKTSSPIQLNAVQLLGTTVSFKIKVEDELLLVPIERKKLNDINMRWLADEAARRYYNLTGLRPILRLKTADGFAYEENDSISVAVEQQMILATVLEWKTAPLPQRYQEMCEQSKRVPDVEVQSSLERAQASHALSFENFWLTAHTAEPIFRALMHQSQLQVLDLGNNFIQNDGCRQLAKAIGTLKNLKTLNLMGNFITSIGLEAVLFDTSASECTNTLRLEELEVLNLSQNPLGNECLRILHKFCNNSRRSLQTISVSHCGLTNLYDYDLCYYQLTAIDVSFNRLQLDSLRKLLQKLNSCRLQCINLSYTSDHSTSYESPEHIVEFFESGTCEKFKKITLNGCHLRDAHIKRIAHCLKNATALELLDLTDNVKLSSNTLQFLLDEMPQLPRKLLATNCTELFNDQSVRNIKSMQKPLPSLLCLTLKDDEEQNIEGDVKQQLRNIWQSNWKERAHISSFENNMVLYTNDKDLI